MSVLRNGIRWNARPPGSPSDTTCRRRMNVWSRAGVWAAVHRVILGELAAAGLLDTSEATGHRNDSPRGVVRGDSVPHSVPDRRQPGVDTGKRRRRPVGGPSVACRQDIDEYRLTHHTQSDTFDKAKEPGLVQGAQCVTLAAVRIANLPGLLPRTKPAAKK